MVSVVSSTVRRTIEEYPDLKIDEQALQKCAEIAKANHIFVPHQEGSMKTAITSVIHSFLVALERFLMKLGMIHLFQKTVAPSEIESNGQDMIFISTLFSTLTSTIVPVLGAYQGGVIVGGCCLFVVGLSLLYPLWRPFPTCMPRVENWSEQYQKGELVAGSERKVLLDKIAEAIKFSPILLIGKEGSGKTELVRGLVQAIARGDYPDFSGAQVFYVNTADLLSFTGWVPSGYSPLSYLSQAIDGHREKIIFVFDHIHLASGLNATLAEQFKTMLDAPKSHFPKLIGIADLDEKMHSSFRQRFHQIRVDPSNAEIATILHAMIMKTASDTLVDPSVYRHIAEKQGSLRSACDLLKRCLRRISLDFSEERELLRQMKQQMYEYSLSTSNLKAFAALNEVLVPTLEKKLISKAEEAGIKIVLNAELVDQVLQEENSSP